MHQCAEFEPVQMARFAPRRVLLFWQKHSRDWLRGGFPRPRALANRALGFGLWVGLYVILQLHPSSDFPGFTFLLIFSRSIRS